MRVTDRMVHTLVKDGLGQSRRRMAELQNKAATQKAVNTPSEDPVAASQVLALRTEQSGAGQYMKNIRMASSFLGFADESMGELANILTRAKELAISQSNDANANKQSRYTVAEEVKQLYWQAIQIGNRKLGDRYIFGGTRTTSPPFSHKGKYQGNDDLIRIQVNKDAFLPMNLPGSQIFIGKNIGEDGISRGRGESPRTVEQLLEGDRKIQQRQKEIQDRQERGLASEQSKVVVEGSLSTSGVNVIQTLKGLEIAMRTNDKVGIQATLPVLDEAVSQVILARSELGSRSMSLERAQGGLQKAKNDAQSNASMLEDVDAFELVNNINRAESALKTTLSTSSKLIQPSLLDFLR